MNDRIIYLVIIVLAVWAYLFTPIKALDLYAYYYEYLIEDRPYTITDFIMAKIDSNQDFMYRVSLLAVDKIGFPIQLVTMFYVGSYYYLIYKILSYYIYLKEIRLLRGNAKLIIISSFFSVLPILVFSISRTLSAIVILYLGIYFFIKKKYVRGCLIMLFSITFHIVSILFLLLLGTGFLFNYFKIGQKINNHFVLKLFLGVIGIVFLFGSPILFSQIQSFILELNFFYYYTTTWYLNDDSMSLLDGDFLWYLKYGKLLLILVMYLCIITIKKSDIIVNFAIPTFLLFCFASGTMPFIGDRLMMFIPILWGTMILQIFKDYKEHHRNIPLFRGLIMVSLFFSFYCIYYERVSFFGFLY